MGEARARLAAVRAELAECQEARGRAGDSPLPPRATGNRRYLPALSKGSRHYRYMGRRNTAPSASQALASTCAELELSNGRLAESEAQLAEVCVCVCVACVFVCVCMCVGVGVCMCVCVCSVCVCGCVRGGCVCVCVCVAGVWRGDARAGGQLPPDGGDWRGRLAGAPAAQPRTTVCWP